MTPSPWPWRRLCAPCPEISWHRFGLSSLFSDQGRFTAQSCRACNRAPGPLQRTKGFLYIATHSQLHTRRHGGGWNGGRRQGEGMAPGRGAPAPGGGVPVRSGAQWLVRPQARRLSGSRLHRRRRLYGSRQLGDSLAGGSQFGYQLLFVALLSNIMAIVLQSLCARLAVGSGRDLAQACRDAFPRPAAGGCGCWPRSPSSRPTSPR